MLLLVGLWGDVCVWLGVCVYGLVGVCVLGGVWVHARARVGVRLVHVHVPEMAPVCMMPCSASNEGIVCVSGEGDTLAAGCSAC